MVQLSTIDRSGVCGYRYQRFDIISRITRHGVWSWLVSSDRFMGVSNSQIESSWDTSIKGLILLFPAYHANAEVGWSVVSNARLSSDRDSSSWYQYQRVILFSRISRVMVYKWTLKRVDQYYRMLGSVRSRVRTSIKGFFLSIMRNGL